MRIALTTLALASALLARAAMAAPVTYDISTSTTYFGAITGTITGEGLNLESVNITGIAGNATYLFTDFTQDQIDAGAGSFAIPFYGFQTASGKPIALFYIENGDPSLDSFASLTFFATGDFDTGLTYVGGEPSYNADGSPYTPDNGILGSATGPAAIQDASGNTVVLDDLTITREGATGVPEPSSAAMMAVGVVLMGVRLIGRHARLGTKPTTMETLS